MQVLRQLYHSLSILFHITRSSGRSCNRINESLFSYNTIMSFR